MKKPAPLCAGITAAALASIAGTAAAAALFHTYSAGWLLALAVTLGTIAYHLTVRFLVGILVNAVMRSRTDYYKTWYQPRPWEKQLYQLLRVRRWKDKMPSYDPGLFSLGRHTPDEIAQAMCQAELVHLLNAVLSFVPLSAACWFGEFPVFCITSVLAACFDGMFVIMQRYNRPRMVRIAERQRMGKKLCGKEVSL